MRWTLEAEALKEIDAILERFVPEPLNPKFMAPPKESEMIESAGVMNWSLEPFVAIRGITGDTKHACLLF
ncbi:hypothetical protein [Legionella cherrii]|uniref:Uncharacterized protein n=1 Tax=Legionella cherrii TaxID=28084 RepID=A0ABY6T776_9GAMM|nr:hypothetical protein [Legionella cherrii]VEB37486.1 Uncharacterised protein [Legionella cherrii]